jgi:hypothetical protein
MKMLRRVQNERLTFEFDSEIAIVDCTVGTLGPTVELVNELENGNVVTVHPRWHSQPNESELSEACAARQLHVAAKLLQKTQIEFPNGFPPSPVAPCQATPA